MRLYFFSIIPSFQGFSLMAVLRSLALREPAYPFQVLCCQELYIFQMSQIDNSIPKRELHWKKYEYIRNKQENIQYMCQCGKKYYSFPALYLHFTRKHNQKITNLHNPEEFETFQSSQEKVYLFSIKKRRNKKQGTFSIEKSKIFSHHLAHFFDKFAGQNNSVLSQMISQTQLKILLTAFRDYIVEKCQSGRLHSEEVKKITKQLPYLFNGFFMSLETLNEQSLEMQNFVNIFLILACWLNMKGYSQLIVVKNEEGKEQIEEI